ncbi:MAG: N-acetyltransferase [Paramuribaculum sp.]|nr:N-acetyltransferase [Paramuribaculum sp.]MDE6488151.1 N-acetyltransferase [Paramuribaculum sp.]
MKELVIRPEKEADYNNICNLVAESFSSATHTDGDEHNLVDRIRKTDDYIPELSLVAVCDGRMVGYVMMSRIYVGCRIALALIPLAELPEFQNKGIGSCLVKEAHKSAVALGYGVSVILGVPAYYSRFGYANANAFGIKPPFEVQDDYFMACKLDDNFPTPSGIVEYSKAFGLYSSAGHSSEMPGFRVGQTNSAA